VCLCVCVWMNGCDAMNSAAFSCRSEESQHVCVEKDFFAGKNGGRRGEAAAEDDLHPLCERGDRTITR
jgi:hypothetical protein